MAEAVEATMRNAQTIRHGRTSWYQGEKKVRIGSEIMYMMTMRDDRSEQEQR
jgi:hypothetical protein